MNYGNLHAINGSVSWKAIAAATGYNADHIRQEVTAYLCGEKDKLPVKLAAALQEALPTIHNEVPLHTYTADLFEGVFELRQREHQARALFEEIESTSLTTEKVMALWEEAQTKIMGVYIGRTVDQALHLETEDQEVLDAKERTTVYLGSAVLHSLIVVWEDAAKAMQKVQDTTAEDKILDFLNLGIEPVSIIDLAETALGLYQHVEAELVHLIREQRTIIADVRTSLKEIEVDELEGAKISYEPELEKRLRAAQFTFNLIEQDRAIVNMNIASISSHAEDWSDPAHGYLVLMGLSAGEARKRLMDISGLCGMTMLQAVPLMKRYKRNLLVARNLAYMALQHGVSSVLEAAAEHLAGELKIAPSMVWSFRIADREPLVSEKDIADKFHDGQPAILKAKEAA